MLRWVQLIIILLDMTGKSVIMRGGHMRAITVNVYNNNSATDIF